MFCKHKQKLLLKVIILVMSAKLGIDKRLKYFMMTTEEVVDELRSNRDGLTNPEAARRLENGANILPDLKEDSWLKDVFDQLDAVVLILLLALAATVWTGASLASGWLIAAIIINIAAGFWHNYKARNLHSSLSQLIPKKATVIRSGQTKVINAHELVLGDIVQLAPGQTVPADLRIMDETSLIVDDSQLTGEVGPSRKFSHPIKTNVPLNKRHNLVLAGSQVIAGEATAIVMATGAQTELGRMASLAEMIDRKSPPVQLELKHLAVRLAQLAFLLAVALSIIAGYSQLSLNQMLAISGSFGVALVPAGLVAIAAISLALQSLRLNWKNINVRKLSSLDTLGSAKILLLDQQDFIVDGQLLPEELLVNHTEFQLQANRKESTIQIIKDGKPLTKHAQTELDLVFQTMTLTGGLHCPAAGKKLAANTTHCALLNLSSQLGYDLAKVNEQYPQLRHWPHDESRGMASTAHQFAHQNLLLVQGGPKEVLEACNKIWDQGHTRRLSQADRGRLQDYVTSKTESGCQIAALAYKKITKTKLEKAAHPSDLEEDLTLLALVSLEISLSQGVIKAMKELRAKCDWAISIISSERPQTAVALAKKAGLASLEEDKVVELGSDELYRLSDHRLRALLRTGGAVFRHINPEDKWRLVNVASHSGRRVVVTGSSVADVASLRHADVAVAASPSLTSTAARNADIVLTKPSLANLLAAATTGSRSLYNFYRTVYTTLADSASILILLAISLGLNLAWQVPMAMTIPAILLIYLGTQLLPSIGLHADKPTQAAIKRQFRNVFVPSSLRSYLGLGLISAVLGYANFILFFTRRGLSPSHIWNYSDLYFQAVTLTLVTLVFCQWINLWLARSTGLERSFGKELAANKVFSGMFALSILLLVLVVYWPALQGIVGARALSGLDWLCAVIAAALYLLARLAVRYERRRISRHHIVNLHHEIHGHGSGPKI